MKKFKTLFISLATVTSILSYVVLSPLSNTLNQQISNTTITASAASFTPRYSAPTTSDSTYYF